MTGQDCPADVALAYYRAWTGGDLDEAMTYVADDVVCERRPAGSRARGVPGVHGPVRRGC